MADHTDFNDLAAVAGAGAVKASIARAIAPAKAPAAIAGTPRDADVRRIGEGWPDPILPGQVAVPDLPVDLLPSWIKDMAGAVVDSTQTPPALAVLISLSVLASCLHRQYEVAPWGEEDDYTEPLSLWTLPALPSGARKTAVINALSVPLVEWEKLERDRLRPEIARVNSARAVSKKRIEKLIKDAVNAEKDEDRESIRKLIEQEEQDMPSEIRAPRLFTGDCTAERLQALLVEHSERMSVLSDEAGIFLIMAGLYSGGIASLDVFLQGHAGTAMRVDRAGRTAHLDKPALSFGLALQPGVLAEVASSRRFRDSGLMARFLFAIPPSNVGNRDVRRRWSIPHYIRNEYAARLHGLLSGRSLVAGKPRVIGMTDAARALWLDFSAEIEQELVPRGKLDAIADWASKLPGAAARIAALFELAESGDAANSVGKTSTGQAVKLCRLLIPHAHAAFGLLGADPIDADALAIVKWATVPGKGRPTFKKSECQKALEGRFRSIAKLDKAIERLEQGDVAKVEKLPNKGARATTLVRMNPRLFFE
ncbi:YfjI family protein [Accumulibacter sp.]|uniref:YfjI family protein n=1 Tax=Accumulibacter sp. TaxID=2053492 RepID=UPI001A3E9FDD|nr:YfjI family protein [Accumulibacter sp.]MBL8373793.1 DUF3987 domain-containing protein [Accumulibacter sp.]